MQKFCQLCWQRGRISDQLSSVSCSLKTRTAWSLWIFCHWAHQISRRSCKSCTSNCASSRPLGGPTWQKLKAHEDAARGDFNQQVMRQQEALDEAWKEQKTLNLQIHVSNSCSAGALLVSQARTIASEHFSGSLQSSQGSQSGVHGVPVV